MRKINKAGEDFIVKWEGERLQAYQDIVGVWTIGVGHTSRAGPPTVYKGMKISQAESREIFQRDLEIPYKAIERHVKVPLNDNQYTVLVSFVHNLGETNFAKSTLLKKLNSGDYKSVPSELMKWVIAGKKFSQGLANRRQDEGKLWNTVSNTSGKATEASPKASEAPAGPTLGSIIVSLLRAFLGGKKT